MNGVGGSLPLGSISEAMPRQYEPTPSHAESAMRFMHVLYVKVCCLSLGSEWGAKSPICYAVLKYNTDFLK